MRDLLKNADIVVPLAAIVGAPSSTRDQIATVSVNRDAVVMLVKLLSPTQQIVYPMTNSSYGTGEAGKTCTEDTPFLPISLYASTKVEAEIAILSHPNAISVRLATVFGMSPRMRIDLLVNDFVYRAVKDRAVVIFEGHFRRSYVHIRDVASVFLHCMEHFDAMRGRPYNLGLDKANLSKIELCQLIQQKIPEFVFLEAPIGEDPDQRNYVVSSARLHSTGFFPSYSLAQGIDELLKGYTTLSNSDYGNV